MKTQMYQKDQIGDNLLYKIRLTTELKPIYCKEVNIFKNNKSKLILLCVPQIRYHKLGTTLSFLQVLSFHLPLILSWQYLHSHFINKETKT